MVKFQYVFCQISSSPCLLKHWGKLLEYKKLKIVLELEVFLISICAFVDLKAIMCEEIQADQISSIDAQLTTGNQPSTQETDRTGECVRI